MRRLLMFLCAACVAFALLCGWVAWRVHQQSQVDEARPADLIIILGAAEYRGFPSPVLKSRLDHGLRLYQAKLAPRILTTGGSGGDPDFTEGEVGRNYLVRKGVPSEAILVEPEGESTLHSVAAVGEIMVRDGFKSCILVTDGYHMFRAKRMLEARGIQVYGSPRAAGPHEASRHPWLVLRQSAGYLLWSLGLGR
jgi:uncharacterized SAM-binding protein YcdF (DUF218 family)